jgi:hypothetical protein
MQPTDGNTDAAVWAFMAKQLINLVDTLKVVKVTGVHPGPGSPPIAGTVDVQILVNLLDGSGNSTPNGIVYGMPYLRLGGGPWQIACDPAVGDIGFAIASDRDISSFKAAVANGKSGPVNPGSFRKYDISDGVYFGGWGNGAPSASIWLKPDGTFVITDKLANVIQSSAAGITLTPAPAGTININGPVTMPDGAAITGNALATGTVIAGSGGADQVGLQTHTHNLIVATTGHPTTAPIAGT